MFEQEYCWTESSPGIMVSTLLDSKRWLDIQSIGASSDNIIKVQGWTATTHPVSNTTVKFCGGVPACTVPYHLFRRKIIQSKAVLGVRGREAY